MSVVVDAVSLLHKELVCEYPAANYLGIKPRWERRRMIVKEVRDILAHPLLTSTVEGEPLVNRGQFLVVALDLDKNATRSFYFNAMRNIQVIRSTGDWCAVWIETPHDWYPGDELPIEFEVAGELLTEVSYLVASIVADAGNSYRAKAGFTGRWLLAMSMKTLE